MESGGVSLVAVADGGGVGAGRRRRAMKNSEEGRLWRAASCLYASMASWLVGHPGQWLNRPCRPSSCLDWCGTPAGWHRRRLVYSQQARRVQQDNGPIIGRFPQEQPEPAREHVLPELPVSSWPRALSTAAQATVLTCGWVGGWGAPCWRRRSASAALSPSLRARASLSFGAKIFGSASDDVTSTTRTSFRPSCTYYRRARPVHSAVCAKLCNSYVQ